MWEWNQVSDCKERICAYIRAEGAEEYTCSKMQEVSKGSRKMNSEELHELWEPNTLGSQTKESVMCGKGVTHCAECNA